MSNFLDVLLGEGDRYDSVTQFVWHKMDIKGRFSFVIQYVPDNQTKEQFIYYSLDENISGRLLKKDSARDMISGSTCFYSYITNKDPYLRTAFLAFALERQAANPNQLFQAADAVVNPAVNQALRALGTLLLGLVDEERDRPDFRLSRAVADCAGVIAQKKGEGKWCSIS